jgi:hypothetical protein
MYWFEAEFNAEHDALLSFFYFDIKSSRKEQFKISQKRASKNNHLVALFVWFSLKFILFLEV